MPFQKHYLSNTEVDYECRSKYVLVGESKLRCQDGEWEEKNITCLRMYILKLNIHFKQHQPWVINLANLVSGVDPIVLFWHAVLLNVLGTPVAHTQVYQQSIARQLKGILLFVCLQLTVWSPKTTRSHPRNIGTNSWMGRSFIFSAHSPQNISLQHVLTESGAEKWNVSVRALKINPKLNTHKVYRRQSLN